LIPFPEQKYNIIYVDPPWKFRNKNTGGNLKSGSAFHYDVMTLQDICNLPVQDITDNNCMLFMWWVASQPKEAIEVVASWGFTLKTMTGFNWVKKTKNWKEFFGMGFYTRQGSENCLIATKGKPKVYSHSVRSVFEAQNKKHSQKPFVTREKIVELAGDLPRIELFARDKVLGWDHWGLEVDKID